MSPLRWLVAVLLVVAVALGLVDRLAVRVADNLVATKLQSVAHLSSTPDVDIRGWPFFTQAIAGNYRDVHVVVHDLHGSGVTAQTVDAILQGMHVPLSDALRGQVNAVPVDLVAASATFAFADVAAALRPRGLAVQLASAGPDTLQVTGTRAGVPGTFSAVVAVSLVQSLLAFRVVSIADPALPPAQRAELARLLSMRLDVGGLPFATTLDSLTVQPTGLVVTAHADRVVLRKGELNQPAAAQSRRLPAGRIW